MEAKLSQSRDTLSHTDTGKPPGPPDSQGWRRALRVAWAVLSILVCCGLLVSAATPSLLWIQAPLEGEILGIGGVEVRVRFPRERVIQVESFLALLNGADVTTEFTTGSNGAIGRLFGLLDGENSLHLEIYGDRGGVPDRLLRDMRDVRFLFRQPQGLDRG